MADKKLEIILSAKDRSTKTFKQFSSRVQSLTKNVFSLRGAFVSLAGAGGLGLFVKKQLEAADAIGKAADVIGVSTDALQEYRYAASLSGVETNVLDQSLKAFAKRVGEAQQGTGALTTFLRKFDQELLSNIKQAGSTEDALRLLFDRMGRTADQTDRAALASAAFSRAGIGMTNMVKSGSAALKRMRQDARDLGIVLNEDLIRASENANDQLFKLGRVVSTQLTTAVASFAPEIAQAAQNMAGWVKENRAFIGQKVHEHIDTLKTSLVALQGPIQFVGQHWKMIMGAYMGAKVGGPIGAFLGAGAGAWLEVYQKIATAIDKAHAKTVEQTKARIAGLENQKKHARAATAVVGDYDRMIDEINKKLAKEKVLLIQLELQKESSFTAEVARRAKGQGRPGLSGDKSAINAAVANVAAGLKQEAVEYAAFLKQVELLQKQATASLGELQKSAADKLEEALADPDEYFGPFEKKGVDTFKNLENAVTGWASTWSDSLNEMLWGAETTFSDILRSFLKMITQMVIQKQIVEPLMGAGLKFLGGLFHGGGVVGQTPVQPVLAPAKLWANAPRLHQGLASDEYPAILQRGETVLPRGAGGMSPRSIRIEIENKGAEKQATVGTMRFEPEAVVVGIVLKDLQQNGPLRQALGAGVV